MKQLLQLIIILFIGLSACTEKIVETTGSIFGTVQDATTGKLLENCSVLLNPLGLTTTTGRDGSFHFAHIEGGEYSIQTSKIGYATSSKKLPSHLDIRTTQTFYCMKHHPLWEQFMER